MLIGTQMVAKGHDFPDVTLGVVLDADATLRFPDFRAEERTFALIAQLAGRAGEAATGACWCRRSLRRPRSIVHAARHDSDGFLAGELQRRRALRYPPFSHLIRVVCAAERAGAAPAPRRGRARSPRRLPGPAVLGPAPLFRLRGRERQVLVVKAAERRAAVHAVGAAVRRRPRQPARPASASAWTSTRSRRPAGVRGAFGLAVNVLAASPGPAADDLDQGHGRREEVERDARPEPSPSSTSRQGAPRRGACAHVRKFGDPVLRARALPVDRFDEALNEEVERMGLLMHDALGIGLAATQLGVLHRVLVYRASGRTR